MTADPRSTALQRGDNLEIRVSELRDAIGDGHWRVLSAGASLYYLPEWFAALAPELGGRALAFTATRAGRPLGMLPAFEVRNPRQAMHHPRLAVLRPAQLVALLNARAGWLPPLVARGVQRPLLAALDRLVLPALVCTSPLAYASEALVDPDESDPGGVIDALLRAAEVHARARGYRSISFLWIPATQTHLLAALRRAGYRTGAVAAKYHLHVRWSSFSEYLKTFRQARRARMRHEIATFETAGVQVRQVLNWPEIEERAVALALAHQHRYGENISYDKLADRYHRLIQHLAGSDLHLTAWLNGNMVGIVTAFRKGDILYPKLVGFDYLVAEKLFVYFNLVFYNLLTRAIELGVREIDYGLSADEGKLLRGCDMVPVHCAFRSFAAPCDRMGAWYLSRLHQETVARQARLMETFGNGPRAHEA